MNDQDMQRIDISIDQLKNKISLQAALKRLSKNKDFKEVFLDKYLKDYAVRLVHLKASMGAQKEVDQEYITKQLSAIGFMNQYMLFIDQEGEISKKQLQDNEAEREALIAEEG